jgi:hypothetical protein
MIVNDDFIFQGDTTRKGKSLEDADSGVGHGFSLVISALTLKEAHLIVLSDDTLIP